MTAIWAAVYFWARVVHAVVYWASALYVRTLAFVMRFVAVLGIFWEIVACPDLIAGAAVPCIN